MPGNKWITKQVFTPIGPSIAYVGLTQGLFSIIDSEDAETVGKFNWRAAYRTRGRCFYAVKSTKREGKGHVEQTLQEFLMGECEGFQVDHIHGKTLDNRKSQLRHATRSQQKMNSSIYANNKSGHKGVHWRERDKQWSAMIGFEGRLIHLGQFDEKSEAIEARQSAEKKYFGEYARVIR
jgi:hypothetical protein